jgi:hypothetical protein
MKKFINIIAVFAVVLLASCTASKTTTKAPEKPKSSCEKEFSVSSPLYKQSFPQIDSLFKRYPVMKQLLEDSTILDNPELAKLKVDSAFDFMSKEYAKVVDRMPNVFYRIQRSVDAQNMGTHDIVIRTVRDSCGAQLMALYYVSGQIFTKYNAVNAFTETKRFRRFDVSINDVKHPMAKEILQYTYNGIQTKDWFGRLIDLEKQTLYYLRGSQQLEFFTDSKAVDSVFATQAQTSYRGILPTNWTTGNKKLLLRDYFRKSFDTTVVANPCLFKDLDAKKAFFAPEEATRGVAAIQTAKMVDILVEAFVKTYYIREKNQ